MSRTAIRRSILTAALVVPTALFAQKPTAQAVFDKHAAAVGGVPAFKAATARTEVGTADITFAGVSAGYERKVSGGKMIMTIDVAGFGQVVQGFDGTTAWAMDPQQGARKMDAATSADAASRARPKRILMRNDTTDAIEAAALQPQGVGCPDFCLRLTKH